MKREPKPGFAIGDRVMWNDDREDLGVVTNIAFDCVTIKWDNGCIGTIGTIDIKKRVLKVESRL